MLTMMIMTTRLIILPLAHVRRVIIVSTGISVLHLFLVYWLREVGVQGTMYTVVSLVSVHGRLNINTDMARMGMYPGYKYHKFVWRLLH